MEETIWEILHLDTPTSNIDEIKKAYSEQSKKCNPEEDPEQFQRLYNAYKIAISYARRRNMETEYQKPNIGVMTQENDTNELFDEIEKNEIKREINSIYEFDNKENELLETFESIDKVDRYEFDRVQKMIAAIDQNFSNPDELEKVVESEEFFELMKLRDFQTNLSIYLNNRPGNYDPNYVIYVAYKRFFKENPDSICIESLKKYFDPLVKNLAGGNKKSKQGNGTNILAIVFFIVAMTMWFAASTISDENTSINKKLKTVSNEVLTYEYDENIKEIVSKDEDFSITYTIPEGFKMSEDNLNRDYGKYYKNNNNIEFGISTNPCGLDEYYELWDEDIVGNLNKVNIKDTTFYYIKFPNTVDNVQKGFNIIFWTGISDNDILIIDTKSDITVNQFISLIEKILPLNISTKNK